MKAVILAAGLGKRLGSLGDQKPKALFYFEGYPLIDYLLGPLLTITLEEIIVVGGFRFPLLEKHLMAHGIENLRVVENKDFALGNILSLASARPYLGGGFFILNSDHVYPAEFFPKVVKDFGEITAICDKDRPLGPDDMKIRWDEGGRLVGISKGLDFYHGGYIGVTCCPDSAVSLYWRAFDVTLKRHGSGAVVEQVLQELIEEGSPPGISLVDPIRWIEIDTAGDVAAALGKVRSGIVSLPKPLE